MFRALHTWEWVPQRMEWLRVAGIGVMGGSLLALAITGIAMLAMVRRKTPLPGACGTGSGRVTSRPAPVTLQYLRTSDRRTSRPGSCVPKPSCVSVEWAT